MKRLILIIFVLVVTGVNAADLNGLWEKANSAYHDNNYTEAIAFYDSIEVSGKASAKLYYNMGNAYFKAGRIGKSILYYNKAQRLAPGDEDIAHNLSIANSYTRNRIEPVPQFFLRRWMENFSSVMSGNAWTAISSVLLALTLAGLLVYLLPFRRSIRKAGFFGGLAGLALFIFAIVFAVRDYRESIDSTRAIVTSPSASVKSSPDNAGKDLFLVYEGAKVKVRDSLNGWSEITLADGNRGWVRNSTIEMID